jgi:hypothetical protein
MRFGIALLLLGAAGDVAHHALPHGVVHQLDPLLGTDASRAHVVTLLGMLVLISSVSWNGIRHVGNGWQRFDRASADAVAVTTPPADQNWRRQLTDDIFGRHGEPHEIAVLRGVHDRRTILRGLLIGGAGLIGLTTLSSMPGITSGAAHVTSAHPRSEDAARDVMRRLWEDHIVWTRGFIVSFVAGLPDLDATTERLLRNQVDIGDALRPFVGDAVGDRVTQLLTDHILGAAQLLDAAKRGDSTAVEHASTAWYANGDEIAAVLSALNPRAWPLSNMQDMMREHLDLTLAEAIAYLQGDWVTAVVAYDRVHEAILRMADMLAAGIDRGGRH